MKEVKALSLSTAGIDGKNGPTYNLQLSSLDPSKFRPDGLVSEKPFKDAANNGGLTGTRLVEAINRTIVQSVVSRVSMDPLMQSNVVDVVGELVPHDKRKEHAMQLFDIFDDDKSGYLDERELRVLCKVLGQTAGPSDTKALLMTLDDNGDGRASRKDFGKYFVKTDIKEILPLSMLQQMKDAFKRFDADGSGTLDYDELKQPLKGLQIALTDK